jgi:hypothetical protein
VSFFGSGESLIFTIWEFIQDFAFYPGRGSPWPFPRETNLLPGCSGPEVQLLAATSKSMKEHRLQNSLTTQVKKL